MPFKRVGIAIAVAMLAFCGAAAASSAPRAELRGATCRHAQDALGRMVSVTAVMRPVGGTVRMALKFELDRRAPGSWSYRPVLGRQLGQWVYPSNPTLGQNPADVWMLKQNVVNLSAPASYRYRVWFRWIGTGGHVLARAARTSASCDQPDPRPNLAVRSVTVNPLGDGQDEYDVAVRNIGSAPSGGFGVELDPPAGPSQTVESQSLAPGAGEHETFDASACSPGASVTAAADPGHQVSDADRSNNTLTVACPT